VRHTIAGTFEMLRDRRLAKPGGHRAPRRSPRNSQAIRTPANLDRRCGDIPRSTKDARGPEASEENAGLQQGSEAGGSIKSFARPASAQCSRAARDFE